MWFVYILKSCIKEWYYVGSTNNVGRRFREHNLSKVRATKPYLPLVLVYRKEFKTEKEARGYERMLKQKRLAKEHLIKEIKIAGSSNGRTPGFGPGYWGSSP